MHYKDTIPLSVSGRSFSADWSIVDSLNVSIRVFTSGRLATIDLDLMRQKCKH